MPTSHSARLVDWSALWLGLGLTLVSEPCCCTASFMRCVAFCILIATEAWAFKAESIRNKDDRLPIEAFVESQPGEQPVLYLTTRVSHPQA